MIALVDFVRESNRIEGILREPDALEIAAHEKFLRLPEITVLDLEQFVGVVAPGKPLRSKKGMNVRVAKHVPLRGGPQIPHALTRLLSVTRLFGNAFYIHQLYEELHPFMDGNGRSGRVLWLWIMGGIHHAPLGFLHHWYYQSLSNWRDPAQHAEPLPSSAHERVPPSTSPTSNGD